MNISQRFSLYFLATIISRGVGFILLPLYTEYLSTAEYGVLAIIDTIGLYFGIFVAGGLGTALVRFYDIDNPKNNKDVFTGVISIVSILFIILMAIVSLIASLIDFESLSSSILLLSMTYFGIDTINSLYVRQLNINKSDKAYFLVLMLKLAIAVPLNIYFIAYKEMGIIGFIYANLISSSFVLLFYCIPYFIKQFSIPSPTFLKELFSYSIPFIPNGILEALFTSISIILLQFYHPPEVLGVFAIALKLASILLLISEPMQNLWVPYIFSLKNDPTRGAKYSKGLRLISLALLLVAFGITAFSGILFYILVDEQFTGALAVLPVLLLANCIYMLRGTARIGIMLSDDVKKVPYATLLAILIALPAFAFLTYKFGAIGAAYGQLIQSFVLILIFLYWSNKFVEITARARQYFPAIIVFIIMANFIKVDVSLNIITPFIMFTVYLIFIYFSGGINKEEKAYAITQIKSQLSRNKT